MHQLEYKKLNKNIAEQGFTLIQVAILMVLFSLVTLPFFAVKNQQETQKEVLSTFGVVADISQRLREYAVHNGHYPMPADPTIAFGDAGYGSSISIASIPTDCSTPTNLTDTTSGTTTNVRCIDGARDSDIDIDSLNDPVFIGTVPTNELELPAHLGFDIHKSKITYAISGYLTDPDNFDFGYNLGAISIVGETGATHTEMANADDAHFVVITHGTNQAGAYIRNGSRIRCDNGSALEQENCDGDSTFMAKDMVNFDAAQTGVNTSFNLGAGNEYFDDAIAFEEEAMDGFWTAAKNDDPTNNTPSKSLYLTSNDDDETKAKIIIGDQSLINNIWDIEDPALVVAGNLRATQVHSENLCGFTNTTSGFYGCITVEVLTSTAVPDNSNLKCATTRGLRNVNNNNSSAKTATTSSKECDSQTIISPSEFTGSGCTNGANGINPDGSLSCNPT